MAAAAASKAAWVARLDALTSGHDHLERRVAVLEGEANIPAPPDALLPAQIPLVEGAKELHASLIAESEQCFNVKYIAWLREVSHGEHCWWCSEEESG